MKVVNVAITGAAGQIGYALAFRVAAGAALGPTTRVRLHLLEITPALGALQGILMELNDCAFPTLAGAVATDDARVAFRDCEVAFLVGARPRGPGMERKDLLLANAQIFSAQAKRSTRWPIAVSKCWWWAIPPTPTRSSPRPTRRISSRATSPR